jgi:hypothetical protein
MSSANLVYVDAIANEVKRIATIKKATTPTKKISESNRLQTRAVIYYSTHELCISDTKDLYKDRKAT